MKILPRSYASRLKASAADLLEVLSGFQLRKPLGAYEKARINRFLNEVNAGRMTPGDAQQAIAAAWITEYGPNRQPAWRRVLLSPKYRHSQGQA
jgi:hypothetical protein